MERRRRRGLSTAAAYAIGIGVPIMLFVLVCGHAATTSTIKARARRRIRHRRPRARRRRHRWRSRSQLLSPAAPSSSGPRSAAPQAAAMAQGAVVIAPSAPPAPSARKLVWERRARAGTWAPEAERVNSPRLLLSRRSPFSLSRLGVSYSDGESRRPELAIYCYGDNAATVADSRAELRLRLVTSQGSPYPSPRARCPAG